MPASETVGEKPHHTLEAVRQWLRAKVPPSGGVEDDEKFVFAETGEVREQENKLQLFLQHR